MIQTCHVSAIVASKENNPGLIRTNCHNEAEVSGALYFVRNEKSPSDLVPVAMATGSGTSPNRGERSAAVGILLDEHFFSSWAQAPDASNRRTSWMPFVGGATKLGISGQYFERILRAGFAFHCPDMAVNGWLLGPETNAIYTNAHSVIDERGTRRALLHQCKVTSFIGIKSDIDSVWDRFGLGTLKPKANVDVSNDRARIPLGRRIDNDNRSLPIANDPKQVAAIVHKGGEVILVARPSQGGLPDFPKEVRIQTCRVGEISPSQGGNPGLIETNCDGDPGTSGGLYFVRDDNSPSSLIPVAMATGSSTSPKTGEQKAAVGILLDEYFFSSWVEQKSALATGAHTSSN